MKFFLKSLALAGVIFTAFSISAFAQGREVTIFLKDGKQKNGELLSVRDSAMSLLTAMVEEDKDIKKHPDLVDVVLLQDIDSVRMEELDMSGAGTGALIGAGVGVGWTLLVVASVPDEIGNFSGLFFVVGTFVTAATTLAGTAIGAVVAELRSEDAETIRLNKITAWRRMKEYARFDAGEPVYVREIINEQLQKRLER